jgi:protein TonB
MEELRQGVPGMTLQLTDRGLFMSIIRGLRYPTALAFGLLLTAAIFWSLWSLTNVTFYIPAVVGTPLEFPGVRPDTVVEERNKVEPQPILPPTVLPPIIGIVDPTVEIIPPVTTRPVDPPVIERTVTRFMQDRDVQPLVRINPDYPPRAEAQGIEGWVKVQYTITGTGAVTDVKVVESEPPSVFDNAAVKAVSRWRYNPKVEGAVAVERVGIQTILRFDLEEE